MNQVSSSVRKKTQCPKEDENDGDDIQEVVHIDLEKVESDWFEGGNVRQSKVGKQQDVHVIQLHIWVAKSIG